MENLEKVIVDLIPLNPLPHDSCKSPLAGRHERMNKHPWVPGTARDQDFFGASQLSFWKPSESVHLEIPTKLHRHRPQIAFPKKLGDKWKAMKGEAGGGGYRKPTLGGRWKAMKGNKWRETRRQRQPRAAQNGDHEGRQGNSGSQQQPRMEIMKGDKWREMKGDNAAAASWPFSDFGDQHGSHWELRTPIASSYLGNEEGRLGMAAISVISMQGDKWRRETRSGSDFGNQHAGRQMKGDKWRRETRSGSDFGNQQPNLWEVRTPIASSYLGNDTTEVEICYLWRCVSQIQKAYFAQLNNQKERGPLMTSFKWFNAIQLQSNQLHLGLKIFVTDWRYHGPQLLPKFHAILRDRSDYPKWTTNCLSTRIQSYPSYFHRHGNPAIQKNKLIVSVWVVLLACCYGDWFGPQTKRFSFKSKPANSGNSTNCCQVAKNRIGETVKRSNCSLLWLQSWSDDRYLQPLMENLSNTLHHVHWSVAVCSVFHFLLFLNKAPVNLRMICWEYHDWLSLVAFDWQFVHWKEPARSGIDRSAVTVCLKARSLLQQRFRGLKNKTMPEQLETSINKNYLRPSTEGPHWV